jgi:hypothetical protein
MTMPLRRRQRQEARAIAVRAGAIAETLEVLRNKAETWNLPQHPDLDRMAGALQSWAARLRRAADSSLDA